MRIIDKIFAAFGVIGTTGAIAAGFVGQRAASLVMLGLLIFAWHVWLTIEVLSQRNPSPTKDQRTVSARRWYLENPLVITSDKMNAFKISADFLLWSKCTLMLWVFIPPKGKGLRDSPNNRYLFAHHTGSINKDVDSYSNQFVLRHSSKHERWQFLTSNSHAQYAKGLVAKDGLDPGWHHFLIAWDRNKPKLIFLIDGGHNGSDVSNESLRQWPEEGEKLFVGTWPNEWRGHFCETKIQRLLIFDDFLTGNETPVLDELREQPRS